MRAAGCLHARHPPELVDDLMVEALALRRLAVARRRRSKLHRQNSAGGKAGIDPLQGLQVVDEQRRTGRQCQGDGNLARDQEPAHARTAHRRRSTAAAERFAERRRPCSHQGRHGAEEHRGTGTHRSDETDDAKVDGDFSGAREDLRIDGEQQVEACATQRETGNAAYDAEHDALGDQLTSEPARPGAKRGAHGQFALACGTAREQQPRDVRAGDRQQEDRRTKEEHERPFDTSDDGLVERIDDDRPTPVGGWPLAGARCRQRGELGAGLREIGTGREPRENPQEVGACLGRRGIQHVRHEQLHLRLLREVEAGWQHAHDEVRAAIERQRTPDQSMAAG